MLSQLSYRPVRGDLAPSLTRCELLSRFSSSLGWQPGAHRICPTCQARFFCSGFTPLVLLLAVAVLRTTRTDRVPCTQPIALCHRNLLTIADDGVDTRGLEPRNLLLAKQLLSQLSYAPEIVRGSWTAGAFTGSSAPSGWRAASQVANPTFSAPLMSSSGAPGNRTLLSIHIASVATTPCSPAPLKEVRVKVSSRGPAPSGLCRPLVAGRSFVRASIVLVFR